MDTGTAFHAHMHVDEHLCEYLGCEIYPLIPNVSSVIINFIPEPDAPALGLSGCIVKLLKKGCGCMWRLLDR